MAEYNDYLHMVTLTKLVLVSLADLVLHGSQTKQKFLTLRQQCLSENVSLGNVVISAVINTIW